MPGEPRIMVISDDYGNIGPHDMDAVLDAQPAETIRRTTINALGVGGFNYDDDAMETRANRANGTFHYVGSDTLLEQFQTHAPNLLRRSPRDARVQVEFNARSVRKYRLIGYENRAVADEDFRDDSLDFGEPGFGLDVTALYEMRLQDDVQTGDPINLLTATVRWRDPYSNATRETGASIRLDQAATEICDASKYFRRTAAVAEIAEILQELPCADCTHGLSATSDLKAINIDDQAGLQMAELVELLDQIAPPDAPNSWRKRCRR